MKKINILLCTLGVFAAASCSVNEIDGGKNDITDKVQCEFRTIMTRSMLSDDGTTVVWEGNESISIFDGEGNNKFDITGYDSLNPSSSATFGGSVSSGATEFYAVYPYAAGNTLAGSTVSATVPAEQTAKSGSFDSGAAVVAAYTTSSSLAFHNATALLGIKLSSTQTDVSQLVLKGNNDEYIAGAVSIVLSGSGEITSVTPGTGSKTITLSGTFSAGETYYIAFIPQTFSNGITLNIHYSDGNVVSAKKSTAWNTVAGKCYNVIDFSKTDDYSNTVGAGVQRVRLKAATYGKLTVLGGNASEGTDYHYQLERGNAKNQPRFETRPMDISIQGPILVFQYKINNPISGFRVYWIPKGGKAGDKGHDNFDTSSYPSGTSEWQVAVIDLSTYFATRSWEGNAGDYVRFDFLTMVMEDVIQVRNVHLRTAPVTP